MFRLFALSAALGVSLCFGGCASIVSGQNQSLSVTTKNNGGDVTGAKCSLTNDKGTWYTTSPGSVTVRRSFNDLAVNCAMDGYDAGIVMAKSSTKGMAFGNILFGGIIGAGVDVSTGAAYDYPEVINVDMGKTQTLAPTAPKSTTAARNDPNSIESRQNPFAAPAAPAPAASAAVASK